MVLITTCEQNNEWLSCPCNHFGCKIKKKIHLLKVESCVIKTIYIQYKKNSFALMHI